MNQWAQIQKIFDESLQLPPEQREEFLDRVCSEDRELRREIESLLAAHQVADSFMEQPVVAAMPELVRQATRLFQPGQVLGVYRITGWIGRGGMGEVYRAHDVRLKRDVAIKTLPRDFVKDAERLQRFERETLAAAALNHPNIVSVYDIGIVDGCPYMVSEFLVGQTLRELLRQGTVPTAKALDFAIQLANGLAAAHDSGIVHRDLKPENLFVLRDDRLKLLDFGLAKLTRVDADVECNTTEGLFQTEIGRVFGTVGYMSPEQIRGQRADYRSDIFSTGAILYELFSGERAFRGESAADIISAVLQGNLSELHDGVPPVVKRTILHSLEKNPQNRFQSAHDLAFQLQEATRSLSSSPGFNLTTKVSLPMETIGGAKLMPRFESDKRSNSEVLIAWAGKRKWSAALGVLLVLLVLTAAGFGMHSLMSHEKSTATGLAGNDATRRIIAVIPFENISADRSQDYFSAGVTEEINGQLSKIGSLQVVSQFAVSRYKDPGTNLRKIATELGVGSVVIGSVRQAGSHVRIHVTLVDPRDSRTVWSEQYDRDLKDIFAVQNDVALRIADALATTISHDEMERIEKRPTENLEAYQLYLRSWQFTSGDRQKNLEAVRFLEEAIHKDPKFAEALAAMAYRQVFQSFFDDARYIDMGMQTARKALALDPNVSRAHLALAEGYNQKGQSANARLSLLKALELNPNSIDAMMNLSIQEIDLGHYDEALHWARRGFRLVPNHDNSYYHVGAALLAMEDDTTTLKWLSEGERRFPASVRIQILLAMLDCVRGKTREALERARKANATSPNDEEALFLLADLALIESEPDMEALLERFFRSAPELSGGAWILSESFRVKYAYALARRGETERSAQLMEEAAKLAREALDKGSESIRPRIEIAAIYAFRHQNEAALQWLEKAYDAGMRESRTLVLDPMFESVRQERKFLELAARINRDVATMRERSSDLHEISGVSATQAHIQ